MYTIIMNQYKQLVATEHPKIYQRDKLVDKFRFLFPIEYNEIDLQNATWRLEYVDPSNTVHTEMLVKSDELYKNHIECVLDIDTKITKFAGTIEHLNVTATILDIENEKQYVLHTEPISLEIYPIDDLYAFNADESLAIMDQFALEMDAKIAAINKAAQAYDEAKADNIRIIEDDQITLVSNNKNIGDPIHIALSNIEDEEIDGVNDGILDLDSLQLKTVML